MRKIVLPGEMIAQSPQRVENSYVEAGKTYSRILGMYEPNTRGIIPLAGSYNPSKDDTVVGIVAESKGKIYIVDLTHFGRSILVPGKFDEYSFEPGEVIEAQVTDVENRKTIVLGAAKLLEGGTIIPIGPKKIFRIIGKKNTMIDQIKNFTKTDIVVGLNGLVWLRGGDLQLAIEVIKRVEREAHTSGLTEAIKQYLETKTKSE